MESRHIHCLAGAILLAAIYFVFPIPHTAALRNLLMLALIALLTVLWKRGTEADGVRVSRNPEIMALGALTLWMAVQTSLWAVDRAFSFSELVGEWGGALLVAWVGYAIARRLSKADGPACAETLPTWIVLALFAHAAWMLAFQAMQWAQTGHYALGDTPYGDYAVLSTPINMAFALLAADLAVRWLGDGRLFPWPGHVARVLIFLTAVAVVGVKARNGVIAVFAVLTLLAALLAWRERVRWQSRRGMLAGLAALVVAISLFAINFRSDPRWATFVETVPIALDTQTHRSWMDEQQYPLPLMASGQAVEGSAHMRIAWAKVAVEGIIGRPQGYGYGLGGFGRHVEAEYGQKGFISSHSGILDFTLANGLPGLALLLAFCALLFRRGWLAWAAGNPWGLALMLTLTNYFVRIVLDGHFGSFRLKMVALLLGILYWLTVKPPKTEEGAPAEPPHEPARPRVSSRAAMRWR